MKQVFESAKLVEILEKREVISKEIKEIVDKMVELDKERLKLGYKMDSLKEKTKTILDKNQVKLGEFEFIAKVELEDGKAVLEILDQIEEYKKAIREDRIKKMQE